MKAILCAIVLMASFSIASDSEEVTWNRINKCVCNTDDVGNPRITRDGPAESQNDFNNRCMEECDSAGDSCVGVRINIGRKYCELRQTCDFATDNTRMFCFEKVVAGDTTPAETTEGTTGLETTPPGGTTGVETTPPGGTTGPPGTTVAETTPPGGTTGPPGTTVAETTPPGGTTGIETTPPGGTTGIETTPPGGTTGIETTPPGGTTGIETTPPGGTTGIETTPPGGTTGIETTPPGGTTGIETTPPGGTTGIETTPPGGTTGIETTPPGGTTGIETTPPGGTTGIETTPPGGTTGIETTGLETTPPGGTTGIETTPPGGTTGVETTPPGGTTGVETTPPGGTTGIETTPPGGTTGIETTPPGGTTGVETTPPGGTTGVETTPPGGTTGVETTPPGGTTAPPGTTEAETTPPGGTTGIETTPPGGTTGVETTPPGGTTGVETTPPGGTTGLETTNMDTTAVPTTVGETTVLETTNADTTAPATTPGETTEGETTEPGKQCEMVQVAFADDTAIIGNCPTIAANNYGFMTQCPQFETVEECMDACMGIESCNGLNFKGADGKCCMKKCDDPYDIELKMGHGDNFLSYACQPPFVVQVNFGPPDNPIDGWITDSGLEFAVQEKGLSYGWDCDHPDDARKRDINADPLRDSLVVANRAGELCDNPEVKWKIELPKIASYEITLEVGDPKFIGHFVDCKVNGRHSMTMSELGPNKFKSETFTVVDVNTIEIEGQHMDHAPGQGCSSLNNLIIQEVPNPEARRLQKPLSIPVFPHNRMEMVNLPESGSPIEFLSYDAFSPMANVQVLPYERELPHVEASIPISKQEVEEQNPELQLRKSMNKEQISPIESKRDGFSTILIGLMVVLELSLVFVLYYLHYVGILTFNCFNRKSHLPSVQNFDPNDLLMDDNIDLKFDDFDSDFSE